MLLIFLIENHDKKFTSKTIASKIYENNKNEYRTKRMGFDSDDALIRQLATEISRDKKKLLDTDKIYIEEDNTPYLFYYAKYEKIEQQVKHQPTKQEDDIKEIKLYPKLADFLKSNYDIQSKRIDEKTSKNDKGKNWNKWLHPDLIGVKILDDFWKDDIKECNKKAGNNRIEFYSYEVKLSLTVSTLRESFFQAVSNSSWANFGYLVTSEIKGNILPELEMLSKLHGIGIIILNVENPPESQIKFPARQRNVDWNTINRLTIENADFKKFIKSVKIYYSSGDLDDRDWYKEEDWKMF